MLIQPNHSIPLVLYFKQRQLSAYMSALTDSALTITCETYIDKHSIVSFINPYFRGQGSITKIHFDKAIFTYNLDIASIQFKPGLIINQKI